MVIKWEEKFENRIKSGLYSAEQIYWLLQLNIAIFLAFTKQMD